jgi:hypothetical protein
LRIGLMFVGDYVPPCAKLVDQSTTFFRGASVSARSFLQLPISFWWLCLCDTNAFGKISKTG